MKNTILIQGLAITMMVWTSIHHAQPTTSYGPSTATTQYKPQTGEPLIVTPPNATMNQASSSHYPSYVQSPTPAYTQATGGHLTVTLPTSTMNQQSSSGSPSPSPTPIYGSPYPPLTQASQTTQSQQTAAKPKELTDIMGSENSTPAEITDWYQGEENAIQKITSSKEIEEKTKELNAHLASVKSDFNAAQASITTLGKNNPAAKTDMKRKNRDQSILNYIKELVESLESRFKEIDKEKKSPAYEALEKLKQEAEKKEEEPSPFKASPSQNKPAAPQAK